MGARPRLSMSSRESDVMKGNTNEKFMPIFMVVTRSKLPHKHWRNITIRGKLREKWVVCTLTGPLLFCRKCFLKSFHIEMNIHIEILNLYAYAVNCKH